MAARVGTGVTGVTDGTGTTVASDAKSTTTGNMLVAWVKYESVAAPNVTSLADTAGNTWVEVAELTHTNGEPAGALYYALNITGHASNVVTATFGSSSTAWKRIIVEEFSGLATSSATDGANTTGEGTSETFIAANITTTTTGLVVMGVGGYQSLSGWSGVAGTPDFTIGATVGDTGFAYLISSSAQTVTPGASAAQSNRWVAIAQAFKDEGAGGGGPSPSPVVTGRRLQGFIYS